MKTTRANIEQFLAPKKMAIAGVSRDPKKFGNVVYRDLKKKGFEVLPINPNTDTIDGDLCYSSVNTLPSDTMNLLVVTKKTQTFQVVREAVNRGIRNIWIQQMSETPETMEFLEGKDINLVFKQCILMHSEPVTGFHKFHRNLKKFFGLLPK
jgi:predicted CoA-binding protein